MANTGCAVDRRAFLKLFTGGAAGLWLGPASGCSFYAAESGVAFEPWNFPETGEPPHLEAARAALLAASPHNTQPWRLRVSPETIELHADLQRNLGTMDSLRRELHIGLGCALENMLIALRTRGVLPSLTLVPDASTPTVVARVAIAGGTGTADRALFQQIARRHTNRGFYRDRALPEGLRAKLQAIVAEQPSLQLRLLTTPRDHKRFREQTIAATRAIIADTDMSADSDRWYRHSFREIESERDGVTLDATGAGAVTRFFGKSLGRPDVATANAFWLDATRERQTSAACFGVITSSSANTRREQLQAGCAFQRLQLWAASEGLAVQPLNQLAERQDREQTQGLRPVFSRSLEELIGSADRRAQMLFRITGTASNARSYRRKGTLF